MYTKVKIFVAIILSSLAMGCSQSLQDSFVKNQVDGNSINHPATQNSNKDQNVNSDQADISEARSPYQIKPRRKKIIFPDDCSYMAGDQFKLEKSCASAINNAVPQLPRKICSYDQFLENANVSDGSGQLALEEYATKFHPGAIEFYPLSSNKYLVQILCSSGAYNVENVYLHYDESSLPAKAGVLEFPSFRFEYPDDENSDDLKKAEDVMVRSVGGRHFNTRTKELIVFVKARGMGDAGHYARYSFPDGKPKLLELRAKRTWSGRGYQLTDVIKAPPKTWKRYYP